MPYWICGYRGLRAERRRRVLFGDVSPSGKLPVTFYETLEELPEFTDYHMEGRTYRYMKEKAQYPFGFGLTYGDVRVADAQIQQEEDAADDTELTVRVVLENRGKMATDEVLQIYAQYLESENTIPHPQLCGFIRVHLDGGEEKEVTVPVKKRAFTIVTESGERKAAKGGFALYAGCSQPDEKSVELTGKASGSNGVCKMIIHKNPILEGFYPDPSICKVEDRYYMVNSTFAFYPGIPIWCSRDLQNWEQIGNVLERPSQLQLGECAHSQGIYAPTIRYHEGVFYLVTTNVGGGGNFLVTAECPEGHGQILMCWMRTVLIPACFLRKTEPVIISEPESEPEAELILEIMRFGFRS